MSKVGKISSARSVCRSRTINPVSRYSGSGASGASHEKASFQLEVALIEISAISIFLGMLGAEVLQVKLTDA